MPEQSSSFEHAAIEADMKLLAREIAKHREAPETKSLSEKELLKKAIQTLPPAVAREKEEDKKTGALPGYMRSSPPEARLEVEYLLDIVFHHGIGRAVREADKSPDFIKDAFHDALVKMLYTKLQEKGVLK